MNDDNVINMPTPLTVLADKLRAAYAREKTTRAAWIDAMLDVANLLVEARDRFQSNQDFSVWLMTNDLDEYGKNDRAALINIGREARLARMVMEEGQSDSVRLIWEEMQKRIAWAAERTELVRVPNAGNTPSKGTPSESPAVSAAKVEIEPEPDPESETATIEVAQPIDPPAEELPVGRGIIKRALVDTPHAALLAEYFTHRNAQGALARLFKTRGQGADLRDLVVESIRGGFFGPPTEYTPRHDETQPNLRLVLPWMKNRSFCSRFNLLRPSERAELREIMFPLMQEDPQLKDPANEYLLVPLFERRRKSIEEERRRQLLAADAMAKVQRAAAQPDSSAATTTVYIAYGTPLWPLPRDDIKALYTFAELEAACNFSRFLMGQLREPDGRPAKPLSMKIIANHLIKYARPLYPGFADAVSAFFDAYVANPEGESKMPRVPINMG